MTFPELCELLNTYSTNSSRSPDRSLAVARWICFLFYVSFSLSLACNSAKRSSIHCAFDQYHIFRDMNFWARSCRKVSILQRERSCVYLVFLRSCEWRESEHSFSRTEFELGAVQRQRFELRRLFLNGCVCDSEGTLDPIRIFWKFELSRFELSAV